MELFRLRHITKRTDHVVNLILKQSIQQEMDLMFARIARDGAGHRPNIAANASAPTAGILQPLEVD